MTPRAWSYTALTDFESCPRKYYEVKVAKKWVDEMGEAAAWGNKVHQALDAYLRDETPLPIGVRKYQHLADKIKAVPGQLFSEQQIALNSSLQQTDWFAKDVWVRVIFDVTVVQSNKILILDWKTGKRKLDNYQLKLFAAVARELYPEADKIITGFVWLKTGDIDKATYRTSDPLWEEFMPRVARFNRAFQEEKFPEKPNGLCRAWCPVLSCEFNGKRELTSE